MFSGPVTIITSMPAACSNARARATRPSYSALGKADSAPWVTPALSMSVVSDEVCIRGIECDAEARRVVHPHGAGLVGDAGNGIVDQPVGAIELGERGRRRAGDMQCGRSRGSAFIHLSDHEGNVRRGSCRAACIVGAMPPSLTSFRCA